MLQRLDSEDRSCTLVNQWQGASVGLERAPRDISG